jgi:hypothetical protein
MEFAADDDRFPGDMFRGDQVEAQVGERDCPPQREVVFMLKTNFCTACLTRIGKIVMPDERRQIGVHVVEGLGSGPFVLQRAQEVDHLARAESK